MKLKESGGRRVGAYVGYSGRLDTTKDCLESSQGSSSSHLEQTVASWRKRRRRSGSRSSHTGSIT